MAGTAVLRGFIFVSIALSFMSLGCISENAMQVENASNLPGAEGGSGRQTAVLGQPTVAHELTGSPAIQNEGNARAEERKTTCSISFPGGAVHVRESKDVEFSVYTNEANADFTYECGTSSGRISDGGLVRMTILCQFNQSGTHEIRLFADGEPCAQKTIDVLPRAAPRGNCSIDGSSIVRDLQAYRYQMAVHFEGFSPADKLTWICDYTTATRTLGGDGAAGMPAMEIISCNYPEKPRKGYIEVYVGETLCGKVPTG